jgi:hypothetical protein
MFCISLSLLCAERDEDAKTLRDCRHRLATGYRQVFIGISRPFQTNLGIVRGYERLLNSLTSS